MPSTTSGVWFPDDTSPVSPLEGLFAMMATSVDTAIATVRQQTPYRASSQSQQDSYFPSPQPGDRVWRSDLLTELIYLSASLGGTAGWKPYNGPLRPYIPTYDDLITGTGGTVSARYGYESGYLIVALSIQFGTGAAWNNPHFSLPIDLPAWFVQGGSPKIGTGNFENTEGGSTGRYELGVIVGTGGRARIGYFGGDPTIWGGIGPSALGIDPGDYMTINIRVPAF